MGEQDPKKCPLQSRQAPRQERRVSVLIQAGLLRGFPERSPSLHLSMDSEYIPLLLCKFPYRVPSPEMFLTALSIRTTPQYLGSHI